MANLEQDTTLVAKMELKTFTITIQSGNANGESKTYTVQYGENWTLPAYPFTPDSGKAFESYSLNGGTHNAGESFTITSDLTFTSNLRVTEPIGKQCTVTYWIVENGDCAIRLDRFDPELNGKTLNYVFGGTGIAFTQTLVLSTNNIGKRVVSMSGVSFSMTPTFTANIDNYVQLTRSGYTASSGTSITYTCNK